MNHSNVAPRTREKYTRGGYPLLSRLSSRSSSFGAILHNTEAYLAVIAGHWEPRNTRWTPCVFFLLAQTATLLRSAGSAGELWIGR